MNMVATSKHEFAQKAERSFQRAEELELRLRLIRPDRRDKSESKAHPYGSHDWIPQQENEVTA